MIPIEVPGTFNVRDTAAGPVRPGRLLRSAALDDLGSAGVDALATLGIRTVIDLRDRAEKRPAAVAFLWNTIDVPLYDARSGAPAHGDLDAVYRNLLDNRGTQVTAAVRAIAHSPGPVLVHCLVGKDRTGLVIALALAAVGVSDASILADYALSAEQIRPHREPVVRELLAVQHLNDHEHRASMALHLDSPPAALARALSRVRDEYGSAAGYLLRNGMNESDLAALQSFLCGDRLTVLHVSDIHATADGALFQRVDGTNRLRRVTDMVASSALRPDAIVVTGDLCQAGESASYPRLAEAIDDMRSRLGCPALVVPGNHDDPERFTATFGTEDVLAVRGYRFVGIDTADGTLTDRRLHRLRTILSEPARHGTVLAMHHPPIAAAAATLRGRELAVPGRLARELDGTDVRLVLAGHFHHPMSGTLGDTPVWVGGSLAYLQDTGAGADTVVGLDAPSFSVVHLDDDGVRCVPVPLTDPDVLFRREPTATARHDPRTTPTTVSTPLRYQEISS